MSIKRLVTLQPSGKRGLVEEGTTLRAAARKLGVDLEAVCAENGTCGKCKVLLEEKDNAHLSPPTAAEQAYFARHVQDTPARVVRLSCQAKIFGDVLVTVPEESRANRQIVRKSARQRAVEIKPSVRNYYVELAPPTLANPLADRERLVRALADSMPIVRRGESSYPPPDALTVDISSLRGLADALREGNFKVTVSVWQDREIVRVQPGYAEGLYGAAVDIGTTTIALYLCNLETGEIVATESEMNPQILYGEDVMSRMQYILTNPGGLEKLHTVLITTLNRLLEQACKFANITNEDILELVAVGNTTMHHLFLNISPEPLARAPYVPVIHQAVDIKARELGLKLNPAANVHVLPTIASFIGADTTGVLIAEEPHLQDENWLIIDAGTNAELVLGNRHKLVCTSTPTGPALEGAHIEHGMRAAPGVIERVKISTETLEPTLTIIGDEKARGVCGSAVLDVVAEMRRVGILDSRGKFKRGVESSRVREREGSMEYVLAWAGETAIGKDIITTQKDVRQIQLAKAALYVAARTLLRECGLELPDKILLAGGFGSSINPASAMRLGMIPALPLENVFTAGNAAGDGARITLLNLDKRREAAEVARQVTRYELPTDPAFQQQFMHALGFPEIDL